MNSCLNVYLIRLSQHTEAQTPEQTKGLGAVSENILSDRNRNAFHKKHDIMITSVFERNLTIREARCSRNYSLFA